MIYIPDKGYGHVSRRFNRSPLRRASGYCISTNISCPGSRGNPYSGSIMAQTRSRAKSRRTLKSSLWAVAVGASSSRPETR